MRYSVVATTDTGTKLSVNQDSYLVKTAHTTLGNVCIALICDGMGGLSEGEKASQAVTSLFDDWFIKEFKNTEDTVVNKSKIDKSIENIFINANNMLLEYGKKKNIRIGTTASVILYIEGEYFIYHVGDTRIYIYSDKLQQLTQDHTLVATKVKNGQLTKQEARQSSEKNILLQCVGVNNLLEIQKYHGSCSNEDVFLLCCDGLYNNLEEIEIRDVMLTQKCVDKNSMQESVNNLVTIVKNRGETDNISGIMIKIQ